MSESLVRQDLSRFKSHCCHIRPTNRSQGSASPCLVRSCLVQGFTSVLVPAALIPFLKPLTCTHYRHLFSCLDIFRVVLISIFRQFATEQKPSFGSTRGIHQELKNKSKWEGACTG